MPHKLPAGAIVQRARIPGQWEPHRQVHSPLVGGSQDHAQGHVTHLVPHGGPCCQRIRPSIRRSPRSLLR